MNRKPEEILGIKLDQKTGKLLVALKNSRGMIVNFEDVKWNIIDINEENQNKVVFHRKRKNQTRIVEIEGSKKLIHTLLKKIGMKIVE
jgi:hypothetical protein